MLFQNTRNAFANGGWSYALACAVSMLSGCALVKRKAVGVVASTLAASGDVCTRDDDLELVGHAIPFGLKRDP